MKGMCFIVFLNASRTVFIKQTDVCCRINNFKNKQKQRQYVKSMERNKCQKCASAVLKTIKLKRLNRLKHQKWALQNAPISCKSNWLKYQQSAVQTENPMDFCERYIENKRNSYIDKWIREIDSMGEKKPLIKQKSIIVGMNTLGIDITRNNVYAAAEWEIGSIRNLTKCNIDHDYSKDRKFENDDDCFNNQYCESEPWFYYDMYVVNKDNSCIVGDFFPNTHNQFMENL